MGKYRVVDFEIINNYPGMIEYRFSVVPNYSYGYEFSACSAKEIADVIESIGDKFVTVNVPPNFDTSKIVSEGTKKIALYCGRGNGKTQYMMNMLRSAMETTFYPVKVIFHDPATIVFWDDGTKTVVKCQEGDKYDEEMGLALCFAKKALGNKSNFNNVFKKYINS